MKLIRKTFVTVAVFAFAAALVLFAAVLALSACSAKVTLRFETFDGTPLDSVAGEAGKSYARPGEPTKEGYYFDGWYLSSDFSGERQELPEKMPSESTTYYAKYAKYPVLTLNAGGGVLSQEVHLIKPGVPLVEYLSDFEPVKQGLVFGAWEYNGELVTENELMPDRDITLTAKYKAQYSVNVYLQNPDSPEEYDLSAEWSVNGADWVGNYLAPEVPAPEHFHYVESMTKTPSLELQAGKNIISFYFTRQKVELRYYTNSPDGSLEETVIHTRYGAHLTAQASPAAVDGYEFFGWALYENGPAAAGYEANAAFTVGYEDMTLYGAWAKTYASARGGAVLSVAEFAESGERRAVHAENGVRTEGIFYDESRTFVAGSYAGRLDGRGFFLPDDSGEYVGYGLLACGASAEKFGTLTLKFADGTAVYTLGGVRFEGKYIFVYDDETQKYTGQYAFEQTRGRGSESFGFMLGEDGNFLREGEEKGHYALYDPMTDAFDKMRTLTLDGYGGALYSEGGVETAGDYHGSLAADDEWLWNSEKSSFRFLVGGRRWSADGIVFDESGYMLYREERAGTYTANGATLTLDGYGYEACYTGEFTLTGRYQIDGNFVTIYGEHKAVFTLKGNTFALASEEAGVYTNADNVLELDGAGGAVLASARGVILSEGVYTSLGNNEWQYTPKAGAGFKFRLSGKGYAVYNASLYGRYESYYDTRLDLDGYGGGTYVDFRGEKIAVTVGYHDGEYFEICSPYFTDPLFFRVEGGVAELVQSKNVGIYELYGESGAFLFLSGRGGAKLYRANGAVINGEYVGVSGASEIEFKADNGVYRFLLSDSTCRMRDTVGTFYGEGMSLTLDGYGNAIYRTDKAVTGEYALIEGGAELITESGLIRFTLGEGTITNKAEFIRYQNPFGLADLYVGGAAAFLRSAAGDVAGEFVSGEVCSFTGDTVMRFKLRGGEYYLFDEAQTGDYRTAAGERLVLDGCGFASYTSGSFTFTGTAKTEDDGVITFTSAQLNTLSGSLGFRLAEDTLVPCGEEFGEYALFDGRVVKNSNLQLLGGGRARWFDGKVWRGGEYREVEGAKNEYIFALYGAYFRFRIERRNGVAVYEIFDGSFEPFSGVYTAGNARLSVDGYTVSLSTGGMRTDYSLVYAGAGHLVVRTASGEIVCFALEGESFKTVDVSSQFFAQTY